MKDSRIQIIDIIEVRFRIIISNLLQKWYFKSDTKIIQSRLNDFIKSTKRSSPTPNTASSILPPIGNSFMYIQTSKKNNGADGISVFFERTDIIQFSDITFYNNRFSIVGDYKAMVVSEINYY